MKEPRRMPGEYLDLATERVNARWPGYRQPEEFGYDFRDWVSPYTKGAHRLHGIALVLQDWSSADSLSGGPDPGIQIHGREVGRRTNRILDELLSRVLHLSLADVYGFSVHQARRISSRVLGKDVTAAVQQFTRRELEIANPTMILALGRVPYPALHRIGIDCYKLPHPAARIAIDAHERAWRAALELPADRNW